MWHFIMVYFFIELYWNKSESYNYKLVNINTRDIFTGETSTVFLKYITMLNYYRIRYKKINSGLVASVYLRYSAEED